MFFADGFLPDCLRIFNLIYLKAKIAIILLLRELVPACCITAAGLLFTSF